MNTRLVCFAAIVLLGFAVSSAVAQPRAKTPAPPRRTPPARTPPATRTPPPSKTVVTPAGPPDCTKIPGCETCSPGRTARAAPRCNSCQEGYVLRSGNCNSERLLPGRQRKPVLQHGSMAAWKSHTEPIVVVLLP
jgi:hypothetical protein